MMPSNGNDKKRAIYYLHHCQRLRQDCHMSMNSLARQAAIDRSIVAKLEKHLSVTIEKVRAVFDKLNEHHHGALDMDEEITTDPNPTSRKRILTKNRSFTREPVKGE